MSSDRPTGGHLYPKILEGAECGLQSALIFGERPIDFFFSRQNDNQNPQKTWNLAHFSEPLSTDGCCLPVGPWLEAL